jgi:hypothetical protein
MNSYAHCPHCAEDVPITDQMTEADWALLVKALHEHESAWCAIGFARMSLGISEPTARLWVEHLLSCCRSWRFDPKQSHVLSDLDVQFADSPRPEHFTNVDCCDECREHDETLRSRTRENLRRSDLGTSGWSPIVFIQAPGLFYYLPSLARWALTPDLLRSDAVAEGLMARLARADAEAAALTVAQRASVTAVIPLIAASGGLHSDLMERAKHAWATAT